MQSHLGSVVCCLASIAWLGPKLFGVFTRLVVKCTTSAECKSNRLAVLTVKSGDPHMIIELEDGRLKSCSLFMLAIFLWCILSLCLIVGWYILILASK
jgi:hypothetical protein